MKKPLIFFTCLVFSLFLTQKITAQRNGVDDFDRENFFRIGFKAAADANKLPGLSYKHGINYSYQFGGFMQFNFSKRFGIQPEVNFLQNSYTYGNDATDITADLFYAGTQKLAPFNYLQIPVLLNMNVGETRHVKLQLGPALGFSLNHNKDGKNGATSLYKNGGLSAIGGLWIQLPFINIGGRYEFGFSKAPASETQQAYRNQDIQVFIGFTI